MKLANKEIEHGKKPKQNMSSKPENNLSSFRKPKNGKKPKANKSSLELKECRTLSTITRFKSQ